MNTFKMSKVMEKGNLQLKKKKNDIPTQYKMGYSQ